VVFPTGILIPSVALISKDTEAVVVFNPMLLPFCESTELQSSVGDEKRGILLVVAPAQ
jgi:hypothetical protein